MNKRVFITGPSGMGKTTLARHIENVHGLPHISTSAKHLWPSYGFNNHQQAQRISVSDPDVGYDYQMDILNNRVRALLGRETWVCDRSPIDNFVYFMVSLSPFIDLERTNIFLEKVKILMNMGTHLLIIPYSDDIQLKDGYRIENPYYHQMTSRLMEWALYSTSLNASTIGSRLNLVHWDLKLRKTLIDEWLR